MRGRCQFKKTDIVRAAKAVRAAGLQIARFEIAKDGTIVVILHEAPQPTEHDATASERNQKS